MAGFCQIAENQDGAYVTTPILTELVSERFASCRPVEVHITKESNLGTGVAVKGADLQNADANAAGSIRFDGDGSSNSFASLPVTYVAGVNTDHKWALILGDGDDRYVVPYPKDLKISWEIADDGSGNTTLQFAYDASQSGDGSHTAFTYTALYALGSYGTWKVYVNGVLKTLTTDYAITNVGGVVVVTFVVAPTNGHAIILKFVPRDGLPIRLYYLVDNTKTLVAAADNSGLMRQVEDHVLSRDLVWSIGTSSTAGANVELRPSA